MMKRIPYTIIIAAIMMACIASPAEALRFGSGHAGLDTDTMTYHADNARFFCRRDFYATAYVPAHEPTRPRRTPYRPPYTDLLGVAPGSHFRAFDGPNANSGACPHATPVPEPATIYLFLGIGLLWLGGMGKKRIRTNNDKH